MNLDSLLNHEPAARRAADAGEARPVPTALAPSTTTFDAADALTTLATLGTNQQYVSARELPSPTAFAHPPRRTSSFGSQAAPVEPSPPIEQPLAHSPTLDHYHHGSKSPEQQRRHSLLALADPAAVLAPIQHLSASLQDQMHDEPQALGTDVSQVLSPPAPPAECDSHPARDETQNREPAFVRDEPTTSQIREPDAVNTLPHPISTTLPLAEPGEQLASPLPVIKSEPAGTPRESTPTSGAAPPAERRHSVTTDSVDAETLKAIEIAKQSDLGLRAKRTASVTASIADSVADMTEPKPAVSKKRPAPSSTPAIKKKGTATAKKPASKKRRLDSDGDAHGRSVTPTSRTAKVAPGKGGKKGSQTGTPIAGSSPAPDHSSQVHPSDDEGDSSDDNTLYCICRKPDNHRWMIGCDGGCDDWFHGSCVNMSQSDEDLVDKFICPLCEEKGRGQTTWKPMCRRDGCRKPARLPRGKESKYCSDECGVTFFSQQLQRTAGAKNTSAARRKPKRKVERTEDEDMSEEDEEPTPLGGVLRAKDLKALVEQSKDIQAFKNLGSGVLSPPQTASPTKATFDPTLPNGEYRPAEDLSLTAAESERLKALHNEKSQLKDRLEVLKDREKFVSMIKGQVARVAEREKLKVKDFCGYDSRLSWSDPEFLRWRNSGVGRAAFKFLTLSPTPDQINSLDAVKGDDVVMDNGDDNDQETVCLKKRCQKHPQWQKINLQDARFEEVEIIESIKECEKEEKSVRERARRRGAMDAMARELTGGDAGKGRNREGWVEVVQS